MLRSLQFRMAKTLGQLVSADRIATLSKFMFLRELLRELEIGEVLDVGANAGQFATSLRYIGYRGTIVSFEPIPEVFAELCRTMLGDRRWSGHNLALGETVSVLELNVMESSIYSSFNAPTDEQGGRNRVRRTCSVPVLRLDHFLGGQDLGRTLLKVGTRGYEMQVLRGLGDRLGALRAILCEVSVNPIYRGAPSVNEVVDHLSAQGFKPAFFSPVGGRLQDESARDFDYLCVRP